MVGKWVSASLSIILFMTGQDKTIIGLIVLAVAVSASGAFLMLYTNADTDNVIRVVNDAPFQKTATTTENQNTATSSSLMADVVYLKSSLYAGTELPGAQLVIDLAVLEVPGFIVVYKESSEPTGEYIGISSLLSEGEHNAVAINLSEHVVHGQTVKAILHKDDGDEKFDMVTDFFVRDDEQNAIFTDITIFDNTEMFGDT